MINPDPIKIKDGLDVLKRLGILILVAGAVYIAWRMLR